MESQDQTMENNESCEILERLKSGDEAAFTVIYNRYWDKLFVAALARLKDEFEAEEVVQQVFVRLWNKKSSIEIQSLSAYLAAMTRYAVYEHLARESKLKKREKIWSLNAAENYSTATDIENKFLLTFIRELSNELPEKCRMVFVYNKLEDQSLGDVAARMNISRKTAEAHLTKALRFIRLKLTNFLNLLVLVVFWMGN